MNFINLGAHFGTSPTGVACSKDGSTVYVTDIASDALYRSTSGGESFSNVSALSSAPSSVDCSEDGAIVYIVDELSKRLYKSVNYGSNFVDMGALFGASVKSVCCSALGDIVYAVSNGTGILWVSADGGDSFASMGSATSEPYGVACSDDGTVVYIITYSDFSLYKSIDSGVTFVNTGATFGTFTYDVACSGSGSVVYVTSRQLDNIYKSTNYGGSFDDLGSQFGTSIQSVACSEFGNIVYVVDNSTDSIYRAGTPGATNKLTPEEAQGIVTGDLLVAENKADIVTGDLLGSEAKVGIVTGDLLPANAKIDIVTGALLTAIPLPPTSGFPLNYARIGYDNALVNGSASATSDSVNAAKMLTPSTYDKWRPTADSVATLVGTLKQCDYVGIAAHNLGADAVTLTVKVSDGGAYTTVYSQLVTTNNALFIRFAEGAYSNVELTLTGSLTAEIGVVFLGLELEMMRPIFTGHKPANLNATDVMTPQVSDGGQFLGKQIVRQGYATAADFQHLTDEWYRDKFQPFVEHAKVRPYFWAWNLLESPDDVVYGWTNSNIGCSYMGIRNWLQVSFDIEAHA